ncbi:MAG: hypothetical protein RI575_11800 [Balneolaceae bacterium]|nr:hypothetical protein [Balneolaceae bacterium]MDR9408187.1 hypothetical protein [Balneolaceae bacterium]
MKALNTKVLFEYLVEDHGKSDNSDLFLNSAYISETYFLNNIVLSELATSIEENIKFDKSDLIKVLRALESNSQIQFENREIVSEAIEMFSMSRDSFSECLKSVINSGFQMKNLNLLRRE